MNRSTTAFAIGFFVAAAISGAVALAVIVLSDGSGPQPSARPVVGSDHGRATEARPSTPDGASQADLARLRDALAEQVRTNEDLKAEIANLKRTVAPPRSAVADNATSGPTAPQVPIDPAAELAAKKAAAAGWLSSVRDAVRSNDKAGALKALEALKAGGVGTEQEYLDALKAIVAVGQPEKAPDGNALGLTWDEYRRLLTREMRDAMMKDPSLVADTPDLIRLAASLYRRDVFVPKEEQAKTLVGLLNGSSVPEVQLSAIRHLEGLEGREVLTSLSRFATSSAYSTEIRENALESIKSLAEKQDADALTTLRSLQSDADPKVAARARLGVLETDPPVSGYLVDAVFPGNQGHKVGLQIEDIIVSINGQIVKSDELRPLLLTIPENGTGILEVNRAGEVLRFQVNRDPLGIDGGFVAKR